MKHRQLLALLLILAFLAALSGCGTSSNRAAGGGVYSEEGVNEVISAETANGTADSTLPGNQKWVRTLHISAETGDLDALLASVGDRVTALEGYIESRDLQSGSRRSADLTVRIPADRADDFVRQVTEASNVTSSSETVENITLTYVATQSRISALETEEKRLLELMAQAETVSDLLEIEARLTDVRSELETVTSQLRSMDNLVDYATVHLYLREVETFTTSQEATFWEKISLGFLDSLRGMGSFLETLVILLLTKLPYLLALAIIVLVIVLLCRRRRKKEKNHPPVPPLNPPAQA